MKTLTLALCLLVWPSLAYCEPIPAEQVGPRLGSLDEYEVKRASFGRMLFESNRNGSINKLSELNKRRLKEVVSLEYVYYYAAIVSLAGGQFADYEAYVKLATKELEKGMKLLESLEAPPTIEQAPWEQPKKQSL